MREMVERRKKKPSIGLMVFATIGLLIVGLGVGYYVLTLPTAEMVVDPDTGEVYTVGMRTYKGEYIPCEEWGGIKIHHVVWCHPH